MIEFVRVAGYKCLADVQTSVGPFNVLIGRNDSGKSSFLEALAAPGGWRLFVETASTSSGNSTLQLRGGGSNLLARKTGQTWNSSFSFGSSDQHSTHPWGFLQQPEVAGALRPFLAAAPLSIDPQRIVLPSSRGSGATAPLINSRGQGTAAHLAYLALGDRARFEQIQEQLRSATEGRVREFVVREAGADYTLAFRLHDGTVIPARDTSQGLLIYTCFLALVHREDPPAVLLIEEPENGIHPQRLYEVVKLLRTLTERGVQLFVTTHSPDLVSWCRPEEVLVFRRPEPTSSTELRRLPADFADRAMGEPLGQLWAARGEEGLLDLLPPPRPTERGAEP